MTAGVIGWVWPVIRSARKKGASSRAEAALIAHSRLSGETAGRFFSSSE